MGLVVQSPVDALLPVADPVTAPSGPPQDEAETGDVFANLLASLSAGPEGTAAELPVGELPSEGGDKSDKKDETNPFAALMAMTMPLTLSTTPTVEVAAAPETSAIAAVAEPTEGSQLAEPSELTAEGDAAVSETATTLPAGAEPASEADAGALAMADVRPEVLANAATTSEARTASAMIAATIEAPETTATDKVDKRTGGLPPTEADGPQPEQADASSVVRNVGNANTETEADSSGSGPGTEHRARIRAIERPQARTSDEGNIHLAHSAVGEQRPVDETAPLDAPAPAEGPASAPEVPQQVDQVASAVIERMEQGGGEARIHLHPVELGEVTIRVHTEGDTVRVAIHAERREAMNLLRDHTQDLSTLLGERGLNLSDVNVGFGRGNGSQAWGDDRSPQNRPVSGAFAAVMGTDKDVPIERHQRLRAAYNPDGAHFFRV